MASTPSSLPQTQFWWLNPTWYLGCIGFCYKESYMYLYLLRHADVLITEGQALQDDLIITKAKPITKFQVEGDSKLMINTNNTKINTSWHWATIVHNVHNLIPWFETISFSNVFQEANVVADALSARSTHTRHIWIHSLPPQMTFGALWDSLTLVCPQVFSL